MCPRRLASRETGLSADGLEQRFEKTSCPATMMITPFARPMGKHPAAAAA
jgi:hypothetical protein